MSDVKLYLPCNDYLKNDNYDLLESILESAGFNWSGQASFGEYSMTTYTISWMSLMKLSQPIVWSPTQAEGTLSMYGEMTLDSLCVLENFGIDGGQGLKMVKIDDKPYVPLFVSISKLPILAKMAQNGVRATRRLVEQTSYFKYLERGCWHGNDLSDWFTAEWEATDRIQSILKRLQDEYGTG